MRKPYFREFDGWWYAQVRVGEKRKQIKLVKGKDQEQQAYELFNELKAKEPDAVVEVSDLTVYSVCKLFLDWSRQAQKPATSELARHFLQSFVDFPYHGKPCGKLKVAALKPLQVTSWLASKDWNPTTRNRAISNLKRAFNWCVEQGVLGKNPIKDMKKPRERRRDKILTGDERQKILDSVKDEAFSQFLFALGQTGARPGEIRSVTAADIRDGYWEIDCKTTEQTGEKRSIYLTPGMIELTAKLVALHPEGPIFRNTRGHPWSRNAIRLRFKRIRDRLGLDSKICAYAFRHDYCTNALEKGVPIAAVAELMGHANTRMISAVYSKLSQKRRHLAEMAEKAAS